MDLGTRGRGGVGNFVAVCVFVGGFGVADATTQAGVVGDLAYMCPEFLQVIIFSFSKACLYLLGGYSTTHSHYSKNVLINAICQNNLGL